MSLYVTSIYASLLGILLLALSINVVKNRGQLSIGIGTGGNEQMARAVRVQGNFVEYVPLALILLGIAEHQGMAGWLLHACGIALVAGRCLHAWGLSRSAGRTPGRFLGTLLTWITLLVLSVTNLARAVMVQAV